jgi:hypothetical protein
MYPVQLVIRAKMILNIATVLKEGAVRQFCVNKSDVYVMLENKLSQIWRWNGESLQLFMDLHVECPSFLCIDPTLDSWDNKLSIVDNEGDWIVMVDLETGQIITKHHNVLRLKDHEYRMQCNGALIYRKDGASPFMVGSPALMKRDIITLEVISRQNEYEVTAQAKNGRWVWYTVTDLPYRLKTVDNLLERYANYGGGDKFLIPDQNTCIEINLVTEPGFDHYALRGILRDELGVHQIFVHTNCSIQKRAHNLNCAIIESELVVFVSTDDTTIVLSALFDKQALL